MRRTWTDLKQHHTPPGVLPLHLPTLHPFLRNATPASTLNNPGAGGGRTADLTLAAKSVR